MRPPCEIVSTQVLPTIRAILVEDLVDRHKLSQVEVAKMLGITQPAVSQYLSALRGKGSIKKILSKGEVGESLSKLSDAVASGKISQGQIVNRYCAICKSLQRKELRHIMRAKAAPRLAKV